MFTILLHSSKTMRQSTDVQSNPQQPLLMNEATFLASYIKGLGTPELIQTMHISEKVALGTMSLYRAWDQMTTTLPAIDAFLGDIYSGLSAYSFSTQDREYANKHLYILSGLYGILRALDSINPYRLEMSYKFPKKPFDNLYNYWGENVAAQLPLSRKIINLTSNEYAKAVLPYLDESKVITPKFMTLNNVNEPIFVAVHAKIARGAFARWAIKNRIEKMDDLKFFSDLNYKFLSIASTDMRPVFACKVFGGLGLSVRLS